MKSNLFSPLKLRGNTFKNRIFMAPMCQYCSDYGAPNQWHLVNYGSRAAGGTACIIQEATAVLPEGRISPADLGMWNDALVAASVPLTSFLKSCDCIPGIQLAHAGRKASTGIPWLHSGALLKEQGGWEVVAPSPLPFDEKAPVPQKLTVQDIKDIVQAFAKAAERSVAAGYEVIELHAAHGYLMHEFLSPLTNKRTDEYGGSLENRIRIVVDTAAAMRKAIGEDLPLLVRISASDWSDGGWDVEQSIILCKRLKEVGVDLMDVSSGGLIPSAHIVTGPGYQVPFSEAIRQSANMATGTVGQITSAEQAEQIISNHQADVVFLGRELMRDPYWPLHAASKLKAEIDWPKQYLRAKQ